MVIPLSSPHFSRKTSKNSPTVDRTKGPDFIPSSPSKSDRGLSMVVLPPPGPSAEARGKPCDNGGYLRGTLQCWCSMMYIIYIVCPLCLCLCLWFLLWVFTFVFIWFICVYVYVYAVAVAAAFLTFAWFACEIEGVANSATDSNTQEYVYILYIYSSAPTPLKYG